MDIVKLNARTRTETGKGPARQLRRQGRIPANLYGPDLDNMSISVSIQELERMFNSPQYAQGLINLVVQGDQSYDKTVMIREFQIDPVKAHYIHADFYEIKMHEKIATTVPVTTTGTSNGVEEGGILQIIRRELEVYCLPRNIPEQIEIDISNLEMGDSIHVSEIELTGDVEIPYEVDFTVVTVVSPKMEAPEEEAGEEDAGEEDAEESAEGEGEGEAGGGEEE
ncbi:MAG: 50S ribosomal protein L25/general stress protein Ctc [Thermodesulfobacteriota bacterium]